MVRTQEFYDLVAQFMGAPYAGDPPAKHNCEAAVAWQSQSLKRVVAKARGMGFGVAFPDIPDLDVHSAPADLSGIWGINPEVMLARNLPFDAQHALLEPHEQHIHLPLLMTYVMVAYRARKVNMIGEYTIRTASEFHGQHLTLAFDTESDSRPWFHISQLSLLDEGPQLSIGSMQFLGPL